MTSERVEEIRQRLEKATLREVPGWPGYAADETGCVWNLASTWRGYGPRPLASHPDNHGYPKIKVRRGSEYVKKQEHLLVCLAWHGERPSPTHEVRHLDGSRTNNRPENLAWCTRSENARDRKGHGTEKAPENGRRSSAKMLATRRARHGF